MPKPSLRTRSRKRHLLRLPGGRVKTSFKREKVNVLRCSRCGGILHSGPRLIPSRLGKLSASEKRVERVFGGQLCHSCLRDVLKASVRSSWEFRGGFLVVKSGHGSSGKVVICVCGLTGCGKSSVARRLAERYGLRHFSGGGALKALAVEAGYKTFERGWWESEEGLRFLKLRTEDSGFDRRVDEKLLELAKGGNVVFDSWTMPWLLKGGFKVWFEASPMMRAKRVVKRDRISVGEALRILKEKDKLTRKIYRDLYGFVLGEDFSPFDLVLDTDLLGVREVFGVVCLVVDRWFFGRRGGGE